MHGHARLFIYKYIKSRVRERGEGDKFWQWLKPATIHGAGHNKNVHTYTRHPVCAASRPDSFRCTRNLQNKQRDSRLPPQQQRPLQNSGRFANSEPQRIRDVIVRQIRYAVTSFWLLHSTDTKNKKN